MKEKIINSESAQRIMNYILPIYDKDEYTLHVFEAIGKEIDELVTWVNDFENQPFPQFATFTLPYWEEGLGIEVDNNLSIDHRRNRIITKLSTYFPITKTRLEMIASSAAGAPITIKDFVAPYTFIIDISPSQSVNLIDLINEVDETKPAHLSYLVNQNLNGGMKIASVTVVGESLTVYPWSQSKELETKAIERIGASYQSLESISIYPEGSV